MSELAACTIVSKNYLPFARVLARSFCEHHPEGRFFVLLVDRVDGHFDPAAEPFELIEVESLQTIPQLSSFLFKYTILELNTAVKPFLLSHLMSERGLDRVLYLDPDILIMRRLEPVVGLLGDHNIVLTPHLTAPIEDGRHPDELAILRAGAYNLGFLGLADGDETRRFLAWWQQRVFDRCVVRVEEGLFVDQKWVDLVPGMFDGVAILTHPGCNVAYWNLHCREVCLDDEITSNGEPLYFFHFSGIEPDNLETVSRHQDRFRLRDLGELRRLFEGYRDRLMSEGFGDCRGWPYAYSSFADGTPIPDAARSLYLSLGDGQRRFGDPFAAGDGSYLEWLLSPVKGRGPGVLPRLLLHIHQSNPELQRHFPDPCGAGLPGLAEWFDVHGRRDLRLDRRFLDALEPVLGPAEAPPSLRRRMRRALRRAYDSPTARRLKDRLKRVLGPQRSEQLKRRLKPLVAGHGHPQASAGAGSRPRLDLSRVGVNVIGYLRTESGIGEGGRSVVRALEHAGIPVSLSNVELGVASRMNDTSFCDFSDSCEYGINILSINADQVPVVGDHLGWARFHGRYNIGCWLWELDSLPDEWLSSFEPFDEIWTPSSFCLETLSSVAPVPVKRVPFVVEAAASEGATRELFDLPEDRYVFLFVFDFLSYVERKNPLGLVRAFRRAFADTDRVLLVLKATNSERDPAARRALEQAAEGAQIRLVDRYLTRQEVYDLMAVSDCYVSLHRSEGFGLTMAEAMCLGRPVIATHYSANTDFMTVANSLPVRYRLTTLDRDHGPYRRGNRWADPDEEHAAELMRRLWEDPDLGCELGERARADIAGSLGRAAVGAIVRRRIEDILRRHPPGHGLTHPAGR